MFARVISAHTTIDQLGEAVRIAHEQLPATRAQHGYRGFYVLTDRAAGTVLTISLWQSQDDLQTVEAHAAAIRMAAARSLGATTPPADIYQVEIADQS